MPALTSQQRQVIKNSQQSVSWWLRNFGQVRHPSAGLLPFDPFKYQKYALGEFRKHRFNIFRKCRQAGVSKITGAYALWFAMFHSLKTVLIVSRTDSDAKIFLNDNVVFLFRHLPEWMQETWQPTKENEHELVLPSGSRIRSLTSDKDVLRSNASSLNIIDEAAFIDNMDILWSGGWPTLQHGGNCIVISTTNGMGGWYWATWTDAEAGLNGFNPIQIEWWDMDWHIEYNDSASGRHVRLAPTDGLVKCDNNTIFDPTHGEIILDPDKYGKCWSPWLETQYRGLQEKGETWKFDQEVLAKFVGSGNTVLDKRVLNHIETTIREPETKYSGLQAYIHPVSGEADTLDLTPSTASEGLWVWKKPVRASAGTYRGNVLLEPSRPGHAYVMGVDIATGKSKDFQAFEIVDIHTMEQVAEYMGHCLPRVFKKIVDRVGRWYNCALLVIERNNGGDTFIDEMRYDLAYPKIWRKRDIDDRPRRSNNTNPIRLAQYGFFTSTSSKPTLNKYLLDNTRDKPDEGYTVVSERLHKQLQIYVRKRDKTGKDTGRTEAEDGSGNFDDLVMAYALSLVGVQDADLSDATSLLPHLASDFTGQLARPTMSMDQLQELGGISLMTPVGAEPNLSPDLTIQAELEKFATQLGGIPLIDRNMLAATTKRKHELKW